MVAGFKEIIELMYPKASLERERRVDLAITDDGRPRADRATGLLAPEARPVIDADQVFPAGFNYDDLQEMLDALSLDGLQAQIDAKAPLASPTFTGTLTAPTLSVTSTLTTVDVAATGNSTLGNGGSDIIQMHGHVKFKGSAPSIAVGAALGTGGSVGASITGVGQTGELVLTAGTTSLGTGTAATITFATARPDTNYSISLDPRASNSGANAVGAYATRNTVNDWLVRFAAAPLSGLQYAYNYTIIEWTT
jgi:hypothetical protein